MKSEIETLYLRILDNDEDERNVSFFSVQTIRSEVCFSLSAQLIIGGWVKVAADNFILYLFIYFFFLFIYFYIRFEVGCSLGQPYTLFSGVSDNEKDTGEISFLIRPKARPQTTRAIVCPLKRAD